MTSTRQGRRRRGKTGPAPVSRAPSARPHATSLHCGTQRSPPPPAACLPPRPRAPPRLHITPNTQPVSTHSYYCINISIYVTIPITSLIATMHRDNVRPMQISLLQQPRVIDVAAFSGALFFCTLIYLLVHLFV